MKYKLILLDADNTLFDFDQAEEYALENTYKSLKYPFSEALFKSYHDINKQLWLDHEKGLIELSVLRIERFKRLLQDQNHQGDPEAMSEAFVTHLAEAAFEIEGAREVCEALSKEAQLVILTNGITKVQRSRLSKSSLKPYISKIITSQETGYNKPDPAIFEYALNEMGHKTCQDVLMVGDSLSSDIMGGINAGIDTCWYNPKNSQVLDKVKPTYEIKTLQELLDVVAN